MNTWKEQLIEYVSSLDDAISPENAEGLILSELARIKEACVQRESRDYECYDTTTFYRYR